MAIVKMRRLNLIAMSYDKDAILDALQRTNAVEVTTHADTENTVIPTVDTDDINGYFVSVETALEALCSSVEQTQKEKGEKSELLKDGFDVSYGEFISIKDKKDEMDGLVKKINALVDERNECKGELSKISKKREQAKIYSIIDRPFADFKDTLHTKGRIGVAPISVKDGLCTALSEIELCAYQIINTTTDELLLHVVAHRSAASEVDSILSAFGFVDCSYERTETGAEIYRQLQEKESCLQAALEQNEAGMYALKEEIRPLKTYCDHLSFALEKEKVSDKLRATERTFFIAGVRTRRRGRNRSKRTARGVGCGVYGVFRANGGGNTSYVIEE